MFMNGVMAEMKSQQGGRDGDPCHYVPERWRRSVLCDREPTQTGRECKTATKEEIDAAVKSMMG